MKSELARDLQGGPVLGGARATQLPHLELVQETVVGKEKLEKLDAVEMDSLEELNLDELSTVYSLFLNSYSTLADGHLVLPHSEELDDISDTVMTDALAISRSLQAYENMQSLGDKASAMAAVTKHHYRTTRIGAIRNLNDALTVYRELPQVSFASANRLAFPSAREVTRRNRLGPKSKEAPTTTNIKQAEQTRRVIGWLNSLRYTDPTDTDVAFFMNGCSDWKLATVDRNGEHYSRLTLKEKSVDERLRPVAESIMRGSVLGITEADNDDTVVESTEPLEINDLVKVAELNHYIKTSELFNAHIDIEHALADKLNDTQLFVLSRLGPTNETTSIACDMNYKDCELVTTGILKGLGLGNRDRLMIFAAEVLESKFFNEIVTKKHYKQELKRHGGKVTKNQILNSILETVLDI